MGVISFSSQGTGSLRGTPEIPARMGWSGADLLKLREAVLGRVDFRARWPEPKFFDGWKIHVVATIAVDKSLPNTMDFFDISGKRIYNSECEMSYPESTIFALFLGLCLSIRVCGDVAEWSKALPC